MIHLPLKRIILPVLALGALAACAPVYSVPHGSPVRADTARVDQRVYRTRDGRIFSTRAARDAYLSRIDARDRARYEAELREQRRANRRDRRAEREAAILREERRVQRLERERAIAEQRRAEAERAERQARREARRLKRQRQRDTQTARLNRQRAERAAIEAERRAEQSIRRTRQISRRQDRVDRLAPRQRLAPAVRRKVEIYAKYRRPGENLPAFVTRIAEAENKSGELGHSTAHWLMPPSQRPRNGASEK